MKVQGQEEIRSRTGYPLGYPSKELWLNYSPDITNEKNFYE